LGREGKLLEGLNLYEANTPILHSLFFGWGRSNFITYDGHRLTADEGGR
jgi:hypothetical protein